MEIQKDIEAKITYLTPEEGGRSTPVFSGYRGQFYYNSNNWDAVQTFPDVEEVKPGDLVRAYVDFLSPNKHIGKVHNGMEFQVREGARVVGVGIITKILNLDQSAKKFTEN